MPDPEGSAPDKQQPLKNPYIASAHALHVVPSCRIRGACSKLYTAMVDLCIDDDAS
jgi:hypothetical protein